MTEKTIEPKIFDAADYLETAADQADILSDAVATGDVHYISYALGAVARARGGIAKLARETGLNRPSLHEALSEHGNPTLDTLLKVTKALGLRLRIDEAA